MTTIARLAVVAAAVVVGAAWTDVRWQRLWRERERTLHRRIRTSYDHTVVVGNNTFATNRNTERERRRLATNR